MRRAAFAVAAIVLTANTTGFGSGHSAGHSTAKPPQHAHVAR